MYSLLNKGTQEQHSFEDKLLDKELDIHFPDQNKHFYAFIKKKILTEKFFNNYQFTITHNSYDPIKTQSFVKSKLTSFKGIPKNDTPIKHDHNHNQWLLLNTVNGKNCVFNNLAAVARAINVQYSYLYNGVCKHSVFAIGKYSFSRNTKTEKMHVFDLLAEVL
jgi:hypothetical protein